MPKKINENQQKDKLKKIMTNCLNFTNYLQKWKNVIEKWKNNYSNSDIFFGLLEEHYKFMFIINFCNYTRAFVDEITENKKYKKILELNEYIKNESIFLKIFYIPEQKDYNRKMYSLLSLPLHGWSYSDEIKNIFVVNEEISKIFEIQIDDITKEFKKIWKIIYNENIKFEKRNWIIFIAPVFFEEVRKKSNWTSLCEKLLSKETFFG